MTPRDQTLAGCLHLIAIAPVKTAGLARRCTCRGTRRRLERRFDMNDDKLAQPERLIILAEECAELQQIICKIGRHGFDSYHPRTGEANPQLLVHEMGDVLLALRMVCKAGDVATADMETRRIAKAKKLVQYLHHQPYFIHKWLDEGAPGYWGWG